MHVYKTTFKTVDWFNSKIESSIDNLNFKRGKNQFDLCSFRVKNICIECIGIP